MIRFDGPGTLLKEANQKDRKNFLDMLSIMYNTMPEHIEGLRIVLNPIIYSTYIQYIIATNDMTQQGARYRFCCPMLSILRNFPTTQELFQAMQ